MSTACPGCRAPMTALDVARRPAGAVTVDVCNACQAIWFDTYESLQLTPGGTLALFRTVHAAHGTPPRALSPPLPCPRCDTVLAVTQDVQRGTRFSYFRCRYGHGRLTPFVQFLLEKSFVRPLSAPEVARLAETATTLRCSSCGAPVDLVPGAACRYCGSPLVMLDPAAVSRALASLGDAERAEAAPPDSDRRGEAIIALAQLEAAMARERAADRARGLDLIAVGLAALGHWLRWP